MIEIEGPEIQELGEAEELVCRGAKACDMDAINNPFVRICHGQDE